jgi:tyrosyl-tRNA synthetase
MLRSVLELYNVDLKYIKFVLGSDFQLNREYTLDFYKFSGIVTIETVKDASSEVVKINDNPILSNIQYCILQSLDEQYLNCDGQLGGIDQRKIYVFAIDNIQKLGYETKFYLMNHLISGLSFTKNETGELTKMSSSDVNKKIDLTENENSIKKKINKAYCIDGDIKDNSVLSLIKNLVFKILEKIDKKFLINRPEKYGGAIEYNDYNHLENDFKNNYICSSDIKLGLTDFLIYFLKPIREKFNSEEMINLTKKAYQ